MSMVVKSNPVRRASQQGNASRQRHDPAAIARPGHDRALQGHSTEETETTMVELQADEIRTFVGGKKRPKPIKSTYAK